MQSVRKRRSGHWRYETHRGSPCGGHLHPVQVLWQDFQVKCHSKSSVDIVIFFQDQKCHEVAQQLSSLNAEVESKKGNLLSNVCPRLCQFCKSWREARTIPWSLLICHSPKHSWLFSFYFGFPKFNELYEDSAFIGNWNKWRQKCSSATLKNPDALVTIRIFWVAKGLFCRGQPNFVNADILYIPDICHFFYTGKIFGE